MYDPFKISSPGLSGISGNARLVEPVDVGQPWNSMARYFYIGTSGDVSIVLNDDRVIIYKKVPAGTHLFIGAKRINKTGTTAKDIIAHF
jgi:hypothetical protein